MRMPFDAMTDDRGQSLHRRAVPGAYGLIAAASEHERGLIAKGIAAEATLRAIDEAAYDTFARACGIVTAGRFAPSTVARSA